MKCLHSTVPAALADARVPVARGQLCPRRQKLCHTSPLHQVPSHALFQRAQLTIVRLPEILPAPEHQPVSSGNDAMVSTGYAADAFLLQGVCARLWPAPRHFSHIFLTFRSQHHLDSFVLCHVNVMVSGDSYPSFPGLLFRPFRSATFRGG